MAIFKCKMCGGDLEINDGVAIAECEYCGTKQTVPKVMDENLQNLFNRANTLRIKSEFDKAEKLYEKIIQADSTQSEAYWGLILCKYGIEYVDDPATYKKVPTCHRASYDSIIADDDYKSAIANADMSQRSIYEEQAKEIDRIQKDILALAQKEENYDVFICYKETDADGKRTQDSVIANDIYYQLKQEGFKVFYAAITLEGKLGSAYEPIIFAALNSAKVMLTIGTKPEYFNAVWVKNEWSRYLKIIKKDRSKLLIPCYRDMDAYELPEEFAHLQAQDMGKIGFINDIVRGIKKVVVKDKPKTTVKETVVNPVNTTLAPLLKRAFIFLEDKDWESADEYFEKVLDQDPENVQAYLGKLMTALKVSKQEKLKDCPQPFDSNLNYNKVMRYGDDAIKNELQGYVAFIKERNENARVERIYNEAKKALTYQYSSIDSLKSAISQFNSISTYKDSKALIEKCKEKIVECQKDQIYDKAYAELKKKTAASYSNAIAYFKQVPDWKDSANKIAFCEQQIAEIRKREEDARLAQEQAEQRMKKFAIILVASVIAIAVLVSIIDGIVKTTQYNKALSLIESGNNKEAYITLISLGDSYKDSYYLAQGLKDSLYEVAHQYYLDGDARKASDYLLDCSITDDTQRGYDAVARGDYKTAVQTYGMVDIVIPNGVTRIPNDAFEYVYSLKSVKIPGSVTSIGDYAFQNCTSLKSVIIPNGVKSIGYKMFSGCTSLTSVTLPSSLTSIESNAFYNCKALTSITIPGSVTSIGSYAFENCTSLKSVIIPNGVKTIGYKMFYGCTSLTSVTLPSSLTSIGKYAFQNCTSLTSITIPSSVTSIESYAFSGCSSLKSATFKNTSGWKRSYSSISSTDLANTSTAAKYLTSTYYSYTWTRS